MTGDGYAAGLFRDFASENPGLITAHTLLTVVGPVRDIALPLLYSRVIAAVQKKRDIARPLALVTATLVAVQVLDVASEYCDTVLIPRLQAFVRRTIVASLFDRDDISDVMAGSMMTKLVKMPQVVTALFERVSVFVLPYAILHVGTIAYLTYVDATIGVVTGAIVVFMYTMLLLGVVSCNKATVARDVAFGDLHEQIDDIMHNMYSVHGSQTHGSELHRLGSYEKIYDVRHRDATSCIFKWRLPAYPVTVGYIVFFMSYMRMRMQRNLSLDTAVPVFFVFMYLLNSFMMLDSVLKHTVMDWGTLSSCRSLFVPRKPRKTSRRRAVVPDSGIGMSHVRFAYGQRVVFHDVSLHFESGDVAAIMGGIGTGKSTLLKLFMRYYVPESGAMYVDGMPYDEMDTAALRGYVGYVPQHAVLFNRSVYENIVYGVPDGQRTDRDSVRRLLQRVGLWKTVQGMPQELDTLVGKNGSALSGGQRQLLWVLRIVLRDPQVLLLDEPTASMDSETRGVLLQILREDFIARGKTIVMVTHDTDVAAFANTFVFVKDGQLEVKRKRRKQHWT